MKMKQINARQGLLLLIIVVLFNCNTNLEIPYGNII